MLRHYKTRNIENKGINRWKIEIVPQLIGLESTEAYHQ